MLDPPRLSAPARAVLDTYDVGLPAERTEAVLSALESKIAAGAPCPADMPAPPAQSAVGLWVGVAGGLAAAGLIAGLVLGDGPDPSTAPAVTPAPPPAVAPTLELPPEASRGSDATADVAADDPPDELLDQPTREAEPPRRRGDSAAAEARLLAAAQAALRDGELEKAQRIARKHRRRFPTGKLVEAREAIDAIARCGLAPTDAARAKVQTSFAQRFPSSAFFGRIRDACSP